MKSILKLIQDYKWKPVLNLVEGLSDIERAEMAVFLSTIDIEDLIVDPLPDNNSQDYKKQRVIRKTYYNNRKKLYALFGFATLTCVRTKKDISPEVENHFVSLIRNPGVVLEGIVQFYKKNPPDYLDAFLAKHRKDEFFRPDFHLLWLLYENDFISFDEEFFVYSLLVVIMFDRSTVADANFLIQHPRALEKVFLKFYKHETPILDISKWQGKDKYECAKVTKYWTEVLTIIQDEGVGIPRILVSNLLSTLNYNWKKPHINWHISILKKLKPTKEEYLENQDYILAAITSENNTVVNYTISIVKSIYKLEGFDAEAFLQNLDGIYVKEKFDKTILTTLKIVDYLLGKDEERSQLLAENLALGLIQTNAKTQVAFAEMLVKYIDEDNLNDLVEPYTIVLKADAQRILAIEKTTSISLPEIVKNELVELKIPSNWEDLLYHIGLCIKTKSPADVEIFFESLNQLQDQIPNDFKVQIKPYTKRLFNRHWESFAMVNFTEFFWNWISENKKYVIEDKWRKNEMILPFLRFKCIRLFEKIEEGNTLPFLSTPTHEPFYIHPKILVDKLLTFEKNKAEVSLEDLVMAVNRMLVTDISKETIENAGLLKGTYKNAIWYLLGISDEIKIEEKLLPLWTQITRMKNPDNTFNEFYKYSISKYSSIVEPFWINYKIENDGHWDRLNLNGKWNRLRWEKTPSSFSKLQTYTYTASFELAHRDDIFYQMSFMPHYIDPLLCRYIPDTASGNEVTEMEHCLYPLQYLLEHQMIVRHSGWIYIAQCLIFEKRISRDLAREYIMFALANQTMNKDYFSDVVADMIIKKYAPVKRLIESFDETDTPREVKGLYYLIATKCIQLFKPRNKPRSYKKIIESYREFQKELEISNNDELELIIKSLK